MTSSVQGRLWISFTYLREDGGDPDETGDDAEEKELLGDGGAPRALRRQERRPCDDNLEKDGLSIHALVEPVEHHFLLKV